MFHTQFVGLQSGRQPSNERKERPESGEPERISEEPVVAYFKAVSRYSPVGTRGSYEKLRLDYPDPH